MSRARIVRRGMGAVVAVASATGLVLGWPATPVSASSTVRWIDQRGTSGNDTVTAVGSVANGDVYVLGSTEEGIGNGAVVGGDTDLYLAKYDQYGNLRWVRQFGTEGNELASSTIAVSPNGDVYVAGSTTGAFTSVSNSGTPGTHDIFIMKFDRAGNQKWVRQYGTIGDDLATSMARSTIGELYITASTTGVFNSGTRPNNAAAGGVDALLIKTNAGGTLRWSYQFGTAGDDRAHAVTVRGTSEVYAVGDTAGDLDGVGPQVHYLGRDAFIARFDRIGRRNWLRQVGTDADDGLRAVAHDGVSAIYTAGSTGGTLGTVAGFDSLIGTGTSDALVMRVERNGSTTWASQFGSAGDDAATSVSFGWNRRIYVGGLTTGSLVTSANSGGVDQFVARFGSLGTTVISRQFGTAGDDTSMSSGTPVNAVRRGRVVFGGATSNSVWGYSNAGGTDATVTVTSSW